MGRKKLEFEDVVCSAKLDPKDRDLIYEYGNNNFARGLRLLVKTFKKDIKDDLKRVKKEYKQIAKEKQL